MYCPMRGSGASGTTPDLPGPDGTGIDTGPFRSFAISGIDSLRLDPGDCTLINGPPGPLPCPPTLTPGGGMFGL